MESDESLMSRCRDGDEEAFGEIEARYRRLVWSMCRRILSLSAYDVDEAAQGVFVRLWLSRATYAPDRQFRPWLRAITFAICMDYLRSLGRLREVPIAGGNTENEPSQLRSLADRSLGPDRSADTHELQQAFVKCWKQLPGHQRALLQFIDWSDWKGSWTLLASETDRSLAAVRTTTIRYVRRLVDCLREQGFKPSPSELLDALEQRIFAKGDEDYERQQKHNPRGTPGHLP